MWTSVSPWFEAGLAAKEAAIILKLRHNQAGAYTRLLFGST